VLGERWRSANASAGLAVPSAVLPEAYDFGDVNVVFDPLHPDFARITVGEPIPLDVDARLQARLRA
jgi:RES domain-containing protein